MPDKPEENAVRRKGQRRAAATIRPLDLAKSSAVFWAVGLLIVVLVVGLGFVVDVLLLAFAGVLFAVLLRSIAGLLQKAGLSEKWSIAAAIVLFVAAAAAAFFMLAPSIAEQTDQLRQSLPKSVERLKETLKQYRWGETVLDKIAEPSELLPRRRDLFSRVSGVVSGTLQAVGAMVVVFFSGLYFAVQPRLYTEGVIKLVPLGNRDRAREVIVQIGSALKWWLVGKLISMAVVGLLTWIGLWLLGIELALTLGVLAALLTFIPNFGPIIAAVPAVLIGLLDSPMMAVWVVLLYVAIQTVESYLITPLIQQQTVSLPPALSISTQLAMAAFVGGVGLALASPLTIIVMVLVQTLYVHDILGDESPGVGSEA